MNPEVRSIVWHITNKCNLSCSYCSTKSNPNADYGLDTKQLSDIAQKLSKLNSLSHVALTGGEPLVRDDLPKILDILPDKLSINIDTNGVLLKKKWSEVYERVHHFSISVDGPEVVHNKQRAGFNKVIEAIEWLVSKNISVGTTVTITPESQDFVFQTIKFLSELGVKIIGINRIRNLGRYENKTNIDPKKIDNLLLQCASHCNQKGIVFKLSGWYSDMLLSTISECYMPSCYCGYYRATIRHDAFFIPCQFLAYQEQFDITSKFYYIPNLLRDDLMSSFQHAQMFSDFRMATVETLPSTCEMCEHVEICNHGCRAESWLAGFDLLGPNIMCKKSMNRSAQQAFCS